LDFGSRRGDLNGRRKAAEKRKSPNKLILIGSLPVGEECSRKTAYKVHRLSSPQRFRRRRERREEREKSGRGAEGRRIVFVADLARKNIFFFSRPVHFNNQKLKTPLRAQVLRKVWEEEEEEDDFVRSDAIEQSTSFSSPSSHLPFPNTDFSNSTSTSMNTKTASVLVHMLQDGEGRVKRRGRERNENASVNSSTSEDETFLSTLFSSNPT